MASTKEDKTKVVVVSSESCTDIDTPCFGAVVKIKDVLNCNNQEALSKGMCVLSARDDRVMLVSYSLLKAIRTETTLFYKEFLSTYPDRFCPMVMCVAKRSLRPEFGEIYDDPHAADVLSQLQESLRNHLSTTVSVKEKDTTPLGADVRCVEDLIEDDEMVVVFQSVVNILHMASNCDDNLVFSEPASETSNFEIGCDALRVPVSVLFATKNETSQVYNPMSKTGVPLRLGKVVCAEFHDIIRASFGFWKGDSGPVDCPTDDIMAEFDGNAFEKELLECMASKKITPGSGAASIISMIIVFAFNTQTYVDRPAPVSVLECDKECIWSVFCTSLLGLHAASTISHITSKSGKASLQYHTLSGNCLLNLYHTSTRGSMTLCGLVMYLSRRLCVMRAQESVHKNRIRSSQMCKYQCGENCANVWTSSFVGVQALRANLSTSARGQSNKSPANSKYHRLFISEFNSDCSILGGVGATNGNDDEKVKKKAAPGFIAAHKSLMASTAQELKVVDSDPDKIIDTVESGLRCLQSAVNDYSEYIMTRQECTDHKLETILTLNSTNPMNAASLGFLFIPIVRGDIISSVSKNLLWFDLKASKITDKPTESYGTVMGAIAGSNMACYWNTIGAADHTVSSINVGRMETSKGVKDINSKPETNKLDSEHANIYTKVSAKIKNYIGGLIERTDGDNSYGGMNVKKGKRGFAARHGLSKGDTVKSTLVNVSATSAIQMNQKRPHIPTDNRSLIDLCDSNLMQPLYLFSANSIQQIKSWEELRSVFITGALMIKCGFLPRENEDFRLPLYVEMEKSTGPTHSLFPHRFLSGSTLNYSAVYHNKFYSEVQKGFYVTEKNSALDHMSVLDRYSGSVTNSAPISLVFIKLSPSYDAPQKDELLARFQNVMGMTDLQICEMIFANAHLIVDKIKENFIIDTEDDDDDYTIDIFAPEVIDVFRQYHCADVFAQNDLLIRMANSIQDHDEMQKVIAEARVVDENDRVTVDAKNGASKRKRSGDDDDVDTPEDVAKQIKLVCEGLDDD